MIKTNRRSWLLILGIVAGFVIGYWLARRRLQRTLPPPIPSSKSAPASPAPQPEPQPEPQPPTEPPPSPPPPAQPDDLTRIDGIGPAYANALQALGVATFAQLAAADPDALAAQIDRLTAARIRRDEWLEQAAALSKNRMA